VKNDPKAIRAALRAAAAKREKSDRLRAEATEQTVAAVQAGLGAGFTATEIANLVGMSRPALYELMDRHGIIRLGRRTRSSEN
jgi:DNA-directed RNA polymerase specialized sigma subunit